MKNNTSSSEISSSNVCANCGKVGSGVANSCNKCNSVMYCNAACKKKHRHKHKKQCERRVGELHDEKLFKQPPPLEDCPICMIRIPSLISGSIYMLCCGKLICCGCIYAVQSRAVSAGRQEEDDICPFCRTPPPESDEEMIQRYKKRMELNDGRAVFSMGAHYSEGRYGLPQNYAKALKCWYRAAELGYAAANYSIGNAYYNGRGVEVDLKKARHYYELAAIAGSALARYNMGATEAQAGNMERALRHWVIAAKDGDKLSLNNIKDLYIDGYATKDDYAKALCCYQLCIDEIKNDQRDEEAAIHGNSYY